MKAMKATVAGCTIARTRRRRWPHARHSPVCPSAEARLVVTVSSVFVFWTKLKQIDGTVNTLKSSAPCRRSTGRLLRLSVPSIDSCDEGADAVHSAGLCTFVSSSIPSSLSESAALARTAAAAWSSSMQPRPVSDAREDSCSWPAETEWPRYRPNRDMGSGKGTKFTTAGSSGAGGARIAPTSTSTSTWSST